jgi:hypothetical protein
VFDVSNRLRRSGWQVPAYTMPADAEDIAVLRIVIREGFSADLADRLQPHLPGAGKTDNTVDEPMPGLHWRQGQRSQAPFGQRRAEHGIWETPAACRAASRLG